MLRAPLIRAVLFDLDGTLIDNMNFHVEAWIEMARTLGISLTHEQIQRDFAGRRNDEILPKVLGRALDPHEIAQLAEQKEALYRALYAPHIAFVPGAGEFIEQLFAQGIACGIATAAPPANRELIFSKLSLLARMNTVVGAEAVTRGKPAPDLFLEAARRLQHAPEHTLVFEDAVLGVQAGRAAGMTVCGITTSEPSEVLLSAGAELTLPDFRELPETLRARLSGKQHD